jgi:hypothetical protein
MSLSLVDCKIDVFGSASPESLGHQLGGFIVPFVIYVILRAFASSECDEAGLSLQESFEFFHFERGVDIFLVHDKCIFELVQNLHFFKFLFYLFAVRLVLPCVCQPGLESPHFHLDAGHVWVSKICDYSLTLNAVRMNISSIYDSFILLLSSMGVLLKLSNNRIYFYSVSMVPLHLIKCALRKIAF